MEHSRPLASERKKQRNKAQALAAHLWGNFLPANRCHTAELCEIIGFKIDSCPGIQKPWKEDGLRQRADLKGKKFLQAFPVQCDLKILQMKQFRSADHSGYYS